MYLFLSGSNGRLGSFAKRYFKKSNFNVVDIPKDNVVSFFKSKNINENDWLLMFHGKIKLKIFENEKALRESNINKTVELMKEFSKNKGINIILISSLSVYNNSKLLNFIDSKLKPHPIGPYGLSKYEAEKNLIKYYKNINSGKLIIVRSPRVVIGVIQKIRLILGNCACYFFYYFFKIKFTRPYINPIGLIKVVKEYITENKIENGTYIIVPKNIKHIGVKTKKEDFKLKRLNFFKSIIVESFCLKKN